MPILNVVTDIVGNVGNAPSFIYINTSDTVAQVTAAGYLNGEKNLGYSFSNLQIALVYTTDAGVDLYNVSVAAATGIITLIANVNPGDVLLPVLVNHLAVFTNVAGQIGDPAGTAIHGGSIQAGLSGTAGSLIAFPAAAANGFLTISATANGAARNTTITNAALGQSTTFTIPDPGAAAANFILSANAGTQHITAGALQVDNGGLTSGISGSAGSLTVFPAAAASGFLQILASNSGGAFNTTLTNNSLGQSTIFHIPDPANANAQVLVGATTTPFTSNHVVVASGTAGVVADAGFQMKTVAQAAVAGGAAAQTVNDAFCTSASCVVACWNDTTNAVQIQKVAAGNGSFIVTSTADPGASHISYIITKV